MIHMPKSFEQKYALIVFIVVVLAIAVPLTLAIRARLDLDRGDAPPAADSSDERTDEHDDARIEDDSGMIEAPDSDAGYGGFADYEPVPLEPPPAADVALPGSFADRDSDRERCESAGGHWNPCGSPCRNPAPGTACIEMCVEQCECGGIEGWTCPQGTVCTDYEPLPRTPSSVGVCQ
jgi:hypothetical protein